MHHDRYGYGLSTASAEAAEAYRNGVDHVLEGTFGAVDALARCVTLDPGFALGHAARARALMYGGDMQGAVAAIGAAGAALVGASDREASHVKAFELLLSGQAAAARAPCLRPCRDMAA